MNLATETIDLSSDTITRPTPPMLKAMLAAPVGDDVYEKDPTANALQKKAAELFKQEAALFFPSGTMANQTAIKLHTNPGDSLFCSELAHIHHYEGGGIAANSGVTTILLKGDKGKFTAEELEKNLTTRGDIHLPVPKLVCIENTTNKGGGACWDLVELKKIKAICQKYQLTFHLDGARLFNALIKTQTSAEEYGEIFDTISVCLSKGLGAPIGSLLIGNKEHITQALRIRKRLGGGMRQVGYLAAAGIFALERNITRLKEDHQRAKVIEEILKSCPWVNQVEPAETNIIIFYLKEKKKNSFLQKMEEKKILFTKMDTQKMRMVTHLDFNDEMLEELKKRLESLT